MRARILARIAGSGGKKQVFLCDSGCAHLTYETVTLNFPQIEALLQLAQAFREQILPLLEEDAEVTRVEVCYDRMLLILAREEAQEFGQLLHQAEQIALDLPLNLSGLALPDISWRPFDENYPASSLESARFASRRNTCLYPQELQ